MWPKCVHLSTDEYRHESVQHQVPVDSVEQLGNQFEFIRFQCNGSIKAGDFRLQLPKLLAFSVRQGRLFSLKQSLGNGRQERQNVYLVSGSLGLAVVILLILLSLGRI